MKFTAIHGKKDETVYKKRGIKQGINRHSLRSEAGRKEKKKDKKEEGPPGHERKGCDAR